MDDEMMECQRCQQVGYGNRNVSAPCSNIVNLRSSDGKITETGMFPSLYQRVGK